MVVVLVGCISIPIGDSSLKIFTGGIEFSPADSEDENLNEKGGGTEIFGVENGTEDEEMMGLGSPVEIMCNELEKNHTAYTEMFNDDDYIPKCAKLGELRERTSNVRSEFIIENAEWSQIDDKMLENFIDLEDKTYVDSDLQE